VLRDLRDRLFQARWLLPRRRVQPRGLSNWCPGGPSVELPAAAASAADPSCGPLPLDGLAEDAVRSDLAALDLPAVPDLLLAAAEFGRVLASWVCAPESALRAVLAAAE